jgi:hypothetical protein
MESSWKFFDFDKHSSFFWKIWDTDDITQELNRAMNLFCLYNNLNCESRECVEWKNCTMPWELDRTGYWCKLAETTAQRRVNDECMIRSFMRTMSSQCITFKTKRDLEAAFYGTCFRNIVNEYFPRARTLESLLLPEAEEYMMLPVTKLAMVVFPDSAAAGNIRFFYHMDYGQMMLMVVDKKLIVDIYAYYFKNEYICEDIFLEMVARNDGTYASWDAFTQIDVYEYILQSQFESERGND